MYTSAYDYLEINFNLLPILLKIYYTFVSFILMFLLIMLFKYRNKIYNIYCKKHYDFGTYYIHEDQTFLMQIVMNKEEVNISKKYFKLIKKYFK